MLRASGVNITQGHGQSGGNMADKEVRFGIANTALWATATTDASNGSVNGGHDALTAYGGAVPLVNIFFGEVIFGGVGSGLYGMFFYIVIAVFIAGLMVGRTPEYLGKKIEARQIKYAAVGALFVPTMVLMMTAVSVVTKSGLESIFNPGAHGFTEALYAYTSQSNNNGSAFAGYGATSFSATFGTVALLLRPLRAAARRARPRRLARRQEGRAGLGRHLPHRRADVRRPARRRDPADRRPDDLPRPDARADRRRAVALMLRDLKSSVIAVVVLTLVFGLAIPALFTGFAQVAFSSQADGSLIKVERPGRRLAPGGAGLHQAEVLPRAAVRDGAGLQRRRHDLREPRARRTRTSPRRCRRQAAAILKLERPFNPGLTIHEIPVDAVTTSGSGIDPDISPAYAQLQARRVAAVRHLPLAKVRQLISDNTDGRSLGFLGEPGVNVLELNLALDQEEGR